MELLRLRRAILYVFANHLESIRHCLRDGILGCLPNGEFTDKFLRPWILRLMGMKIGSGTRISRVSFCGNIGNVRIGKNVYIQRQVFFNTPGKITIEDHVGIGFQSTLITGHHETGPAEQRWGPLVIKDIHIGKGTWITSKVFIGPGVSIGAGSIVAAGAVVMRSMPENCLMGGVPAKVIRHLEDGESRIPEEKSVDALAN